MTQRTLKNKNWYVYLLITAQGELYIGARSCEGSPSLDIKYKGSQKNKTIKALAYQETTQKYILKEFSTERDTYLYEMWLHELWDVDKNSLFLNRAKQTTAGFYYSETGESHHNYGMNHSEDTKNKIREARKSQSVTHTAQARANMSIAAFKRIEKHGPPKGGRKPKVCVWYNAILGITEECGAWDLRKRYPNLDDSGLSRLTNAKAKIYKGWQCIACIIKENR